VPAPSPIQLTKRPASPAAIAALTAHKATGTKKYKLGQFGDAKSAYSSTIGALPAPHLLVPLYNNRAVAEVDLGDGLVKALKRRVEAWEGKAKWEARRDWEALVGIGWVEAGARSEAVRAAGRCRRMVKAAAGVEEQPKSAPKPAAAAVPKRAHKTSQHIPPRP
jgi:hypothetical protein